MNLHPIFVHFPIAFFTLYAVLECIHFTKWRGVPYLFYIKAILILAGMAGMILALLTGDAASEGAIDASGILRTHETFATATAWVFGILAFLYLVAWIARTPLHNKLESNKVAGTGWKIVDGYTYRVLASPLPALLAIIGLAFITITGALGGSMVYGPDVDPVARFFYNLLIK